MNQIQKMIYANVFTIEYKNKMTQMLKITDIITTKSTEDIERLVAKASAIEATKVVTRFNELQNYLDDFSDAYYMLLDLIDES